MLIPQSCSYPKLSEGADSVGTEQRGDIEWPFDAAVTSSARVWRKVPESDARSVGSSATGWGGGGGGGGVVPSRFERFGFYLCWSRECKRLYEKGGLIEFKLCDYKPTAI